LETPTGSDLEAGGAVAVALGVTVATIAVAETNSGLVAMVVAFDEVVEVVTVLIQA